MSLKKKEKNRKQRRILRVKKHVSSNTSLPRVAVFRSLKHFYAQIIDDNAQRTLASCSSLEFEKLTGDKKMKAHAIGLALAERVKEKGIVNVRFDRGRYLFHGRVKAFAEGLKEGGIKI
jgi:large subunit ribosomal protein L18